MSFEIVMFHDSYIQIINIPTVIKYAGKPGSPLKGYSGFKDPFSRSSFFGFNIIFDHMRVHIPNIGSLALS